MKLEAAAKDSGRSLSQEVERRIEDTFGARQEQNPYLKAMFYLIGEASHRLGPEWQSDPWLRQVFKAATKLTLDRHIPDVACPVPETIKAYHPDNPDMTPAAYGRLVEWSVNIMLEAVPEERPKDHAYPSGSIAYAMPQARKALGVAFDKYQSDHHVAKLTEALKNMEEEVK